MVIAGNGNSESDSTRTKWFQRISVKQVSGYGLTTAHILYRRPDHRWLLQSYLWQNYDLFPEFPELQRFLAFWQEKLEGPLHSVRVAHCKLIKPAELKAISGEFRLH
ncbi:MAG: usg protein [Pseudolabrys sp.]